VLLAHASFLDVDRVRYETTNGEASSLERSSAHFARAFAAHFESVVLCRVFALLGLDELPPDERAVADRVAGRATPLTSGTRLLTLLGTGGREAAWNDRTASRSHRVIPLIDESSVQDVPMIAKLLADLDVRLSHLDPGKPIAMRRMLGGTNETFYVADAQNAVDAAGRPIVLARDFVEQYRVRTVSGMGGAYVTEGRLFDEGAG
jgi:hypothetical protein